MSFCCLSVTQPWSESFSQSCWPILAFFACHFFWCQAIQCCKPFLEFCYVFLSHFYTSGVPKYICYREANFIFSLNEPTFCFSPYRRWRYLYYLFNKVNTFPSLTSPSPIGNHGESCTTGENQLVQDGLDTGSPDDGPSLRSVKWFWKAAGSKSD